MTIEIGLIYDIYPPRIHPISSELVQPSIEVTLDFEIPETVWEEYKDNEEKLLDWAINNILIPGLINSANKSEPDFDPNEN